MTNVDGDGLNVTEAAAFLRMSRTTVYALVRAGTLPHVLVGTTPHFSRTALVIWQGGTPLVPLLARILEVAFRAMVTGGTSHPRVASPTTAHTAPTSRLRPKHIGGRRPEMLRIPRSGATTDDHS